MGAKMTMKRKEVCSNSKKSPRLFDACHKQFLAHIILPSVIAFISLLLAVPPIHAQEIVSPSSGRLFLRAADLVVQAGPITLQVQRTLPLFKDRPGLLGTQWRLMNWESSLTHLESEIVVLDAAEAFIFERERGKDEFKNLFGERLVLNKDGSVDRIRLDGSKAIYDKQGRLFKREDKNGNEVFFSYGQEGRLAHIKGPRGGSLKFTTDDQGLVTLIEASSGDEVRYSYVNGELSEVEVNKGPSVKYNYNEKGNLIKIERPISGTVVLTYDTLGRVTSRRWADGSEEFYEYNDADNTFRHINPAGGIVSVWSSKDGRRKEITDPLGSKSVIEYNDTGNPVSITDPTGAASHFTYDRLGRTLTVKNPRGKITRFEHLGDTSLVKAITYPDGLKDVFEYDKNLNLTSIKEGKETLIVYGYSQDGLLASIKGVGLPERRFSYYPNGRLKSETDALGQTTTYEYDQRGNLLRQTDPAGGITKWAYDAQNRLVSVTDPAGAMTRYVYDATGRGIKVTDPTGGVIQYQSDKRGRLLSRTDPAGRTTSYEYDPVGRLLRETDSVGNTYRYEYDPAGNLVREINPLGGITTRTYDPLGLIVSESDPTGRTWQYRYSDSGSLAQIVGPSGGITEYRYDAQGQVKEVIDPAGRTTRYKYDGRGRITRAFFPDGVANTYAYDKAGSLVRVTDNKGVDTQYEYDALGRLIREHRAPGFDISYKYDALGNLLGWQDSLGGVASFQYDAQGLVSARRDATGASGQYRYDLHGRLLEDTNPLGDARKLAYTAAGDLAHVTGPTGDTIRYSYDPSGALSEIRHPGGGVTRFSYDPMGNRIEVTNPLGTKTRSVYDKAGRIVSVTDARDQTMTFSYDPAGRLVQKRFADGNIVNYKYNSRGDLVEVDDGAFPVQYTYDAGGLLTEIEYPAIKRALKYGYDQKGRLSSFVGSEGRKLNYRYDRSGRISAIELPKGGAVKFGFDAKDRQTSITYPNGIKGIYEYDPTGRLLKLSYVNRNSESITGWTYAYDSAGNLIEVVDSVSKATRYSYDAAGQLADEASSDRKTSYSYLPGGNRGKLESRDRVVKYTYNKADQLLKAGKERFKYDAIGNLVERQGKSGTTSYFYDARNQLVKIATPDGTEVEFGYAPTGERIWRKDESGLTWFVTDGMNLLAELDESLKPKASYLHGPGIDRPLVLLNDGQDYFYHSDSLGSIAALTDTDGKVSANYQTDAFGNIIDPKGTIQNPFIFTGREYEPDLGLYYYRARYYDPVLGRFLRTDPSGDPAEPKGMNSYAYCRNAPTRYIDPQGLQETFSPYWEHMRGVTHKDILSLRRQAELYLRQTDPGILNKPPPAWFQRKAEQLVQEALIDAHKGGRQASIEYVSGRVRGVIQSPYVERVRLQESLDQAYHAAQEAARQAERARINAIPTVESPRLPTAERLRLASATTGAQPSGSHFKQTQMQLPAGRQLTGSPVRATGTRTGYTALTRGRASFQQPSLLRRVGSRALVGLQYLGAAATGLFIGHDVGTRYVEQATQEGRETTKGELIVALVEGGTRAGAAVYTYGISETAIQVCRGGELAYAEQEMFQKEDALRRVQEEARGRIKGLVGQAAPLVNQANAIKTKQKEAIGQAADCFTEVQNSLKELNKFQSVSDNRELCEDCQAKINSLVILIGKMKSYGAESAAEAVTSQQEAVVSMIERTNALQSKVKACTSKINANNSAINNAGDTLGKITALESKVNLSANNAWEASKLANYI